MRESKLIRLLEIVEKKEFKKLGKYIRGPYFTEDIQVVSLFDYLALFYPTFENPALDKERVFTHLYPTKKYDDVTLRHLRSKLVKIVEQYLIQIHFEQENFEKERLLTKIYRKRNDFTTFEKSSKALLKKIKIQPTQHPDYLFHSYSISEELYFHPLTTASNYIEFLKQAIDSLEQFYFLERTKLVIEVKSRERVFNEQYTIPLIPNYAPKSTSLIQTLLGYAAELLVKNEASLYESTKKLLYENHQNLSKDHRQLTYRILANFLIQNMRIDETKWIPFYLDLINWGVDSETILINNIISDITYLNYIITSLKIMDFEACHTFQKAYKNLLPENIRESISSMADSLILFHKKDYHKAIQKLVTLKINNTKHEITARILLLQSYYHLIELGDSTYIKTLLAGCDAFKAFLKRSKEGRENKLMHLNFVAVLKTITKHYFNVKNPTKFSKAIQDIDTSKYLAGRTWLQDRIKEQNG